MMAGEDYDREDHFSSSSSSVNTGSTTPNSNTSNDTHSDLD